MKITKLEYQKQDPNRVNVFVDDKFAVGIEANDIIKLGIFNGQELSQDDLAKIIGESEFGKLFNGALNYLSYRPRSEWEIRRKLKFKTKDQVMIDSIIEKLKKIGQVDDEAFAKWFIDQRQTFRPKGKKMLAWELQKLGVKTKIEGDISDRELAKRALAKFKAKPDREKAIRFLGSRGFDWETIDEVLKKE